MPRPHVIIESPPARSTESPLLSAECGCSPLDPDLVPWRTRIASVTINEAVEGVESSGDVVYTQDGRCICSRGGAWRKTLTLRVELAMPIPTAPAPGGIPSKAKLESDNQITSKPLLAIENHQVFHGLWRVVTVNSTRRVVVCSVPKFDGPLFQPGPFAVTVPTSARRNVCISSLDFSQLDGFSGGGNDAVAAIAPPLFFHGRLSVFTIDEIDTVAQTFRANTYLELRARSITDAENEDMTAWVFAAYQFSPRLVKMLSVIEKDGDMEEWTKFSAGISNLYDFCIMQQASTVFGENFDLRRFPFDAMELRIIATLNLNSLRAKLLLNDQYPSIFSYPSFRHKDIFDAPLGSQVLTRRMASDPSESSAGYVYPRLEFKIMLARKGGFYIWNIAMPIFVITCLSSLSIGSIEPDGARLGTSDRYQVTLALLLTSVAYKFVVAGSLPQVSYLTDLDHYVHVSNMWIVLALVENALFTSLAYDRSGPEPVEYFSEVILWALYVGTYLAVNAWFWYHSMINIRKRDSKMQRLFVEEDARRMKNTGHH